MKRLAGAICAIIVIIAVPSFAAPGNVSVQKIAEQRNEDQQQGRREGPQPGNPGQAEQRGNQREQGGRAPVPAIQNQGQQGRGAPNAGAQNRNRGPGQVGAPQGGRAPNAGAQGRNRSQGQFGGNQAPQGGRPGLAQGAPNRGGGRAAAPVEHGPAQFERRAFQRNETAPRRFRVGAFRSPPGWQYRRWTYGQILPTPFWAQAYWITNFWLYDLDRPPLGFEWVRNGPDALLVDTTTGEILEVVYNIFY